MLNKTQMLFAGDGELMRAGVLYLVDQKTELMPGTYRITNLKVAGEFFSYLDMKFTDPVEVEPDKSVAGSVYCVKVKYPRRVKEEFEPKEEFDPRDGYLPYEGMFRMFAKVYGLRTEEELDTHRDKNLQFELDDEDNEMIVSKYGLMLEQDDDIPDSVQEEQPEEPVEEVIVPVDEDPQDPVT